MLTRKPKAQVSLYKAHGSIQCWSSEELKSRIPQLTKYMYGYPLVLYFFEVDPHRRARPL